MGEEGESYSAGLRRSRLFRSGYAARSRTESRRRYRRSWILRSLWRRCRLLLRTTGDGVRIVVLRQKGVFRKVENTYSTRGYLIKARSAGKRCGQEGESSDAILHFLSFFGGVLRVSGMLLWF